MPLQIAWGGAKGGAPAEEAPAKSWGGKAPQQSWQQTDKGKGGKSEAPGPSDNVWVGDLPEDIDKNALHEVFEAYGSVVECRVMPPSQPGRKASAMVRFGSVEIASWIVENLNKNLAQGLEDNGPIICRFANSPRKGDKGGKGGDDGSKGSDGGKGWGGGGDRAEPYTTGKSGGKGSWNQDAGGKGGGGWGKDSGGKGSGGKAGGGCGKGKDSGGKGKGKGKTLVPSSFAAVWSAVKGAGIFPKQRLPDECCLYFKTLPADTTDHDLYKLCAPFGAIPTNGVKAMLGDDGSCKGIGFVDFQDAEAAAACVLSLNDLTLPDGSGIQVSTKRPKKQAPEGEWGAAEEGSAEWAAAQ